MFPILDFSDDDSDEEEDEEAIAVISSFYNLFIAIQCMHMKIPLL